MSNVHVNEQLVKSVSSSQCNPVFYDVVYESVCLLFSS